MTPPAHLRNSRSGACAILANGPSLAKYPLQRIPHPTIGVNQAWRLVWPTWHVVAERIHEKRDPETYRRLADEGRLFTVGRWHQDASNVAADSFNMQVRDNWQSADIALGVKVCSSTTGTVTLAAMQIARWLGFETAYCVGLDLEGPKFTGERSGNLKGQIALFREMAPTIAAAGLRVVCIEPSLAPFETIPWPWGMTP